MSDLKALRYFVRVAETGSFSRAANALGVTQPAVSRMVRRLEADLGVELLHRSGRESAVTEAGEILLARARDLELQASRLWDDVRAGADTPSGSLSIGVANIIGQLLLPSVLPEFRRRFPAVRLHVSEGYSGFVEEWLMERRIEAALLWGSPRSSDIDIKPLISVDMCLIAPPRPLPEWEGASGLGPSCTMRQVLQLPLILPALPHALRLMAETAAQKAGVQLGIAMEVEGLALAAELVRAGAGYSLMTHPGPQNEFRRDRVRVLPIRSPSRQWILSFATLRATRSTAAVRELYRCVREACERKVQAGELIARIPTRS